MTDRDQFAAAALTGILASGSWRSDGDAVEWAYTMADAMIRQRDATSGTPQPRLVLTHAQREAIKAAIIAADFYDGEMDGMDSGVKRILRAMVEGDA